MARKELSDFGYDYQAYANYLESAECANDEGYSVYADTRGNIYESDDWTKRHSHKNTNTGYNRGIDDKRSQGRPWKNPWLKYANKLGVTEEEIQLIWDLYNTQTTLKDETIETEQQLGKLR